MALSFGVAWSYGTAANLANDYSMSSNPNGDWSYGSRSAPTGTAFSIFTANALASGVTGTMRYWRDPSVQYLGVYKNMGTVLFNGGEGTLVPAGETMLHPSNGIAAVARYQVPNTGQYRIVSATTRAGGHAGLARFSIVINGAVIYGENATQIYIYQALHTESVNLTTGDLLDFVVDRGDANLASDSTGIRVGVYRETLIEPVQVATIETTEGIEFEGDVSSLLNSDNSRYSALSDDSTLGATMEMFGMMTVVDPTCVWFNYESVAGRPGLAEEVSFYDTVANQWASMFGRVAPINDSATTVTVLQNTARFKSGLGLVGARIQWRPINDEDPSQDGWLLSLDQASWEAAH